MMNRQGVLTMLKRLGAQAQERGIESLNEHQRNVLVPYWAFGILENGGFKYFYEGTYDLADVARRFGSLGLTHVASACAHVANEIFGEGSVPTPAQRRAILARVDWEAYRPQKQVVFGLSWEALEDAIAAYVSTHPEVAG